MRIYEGSPRQDFEEVLRSIGAYLDQRGMTDVLVMEVPDGFIVQGLAHVGATSSAWSESVGQVAKETMTFLDEDIARFMDESVARRGAGPHPANPGAGRYEHAFRVIGRYIDEQRPRDIFFFEQEGAFVLRPREPEVLQNLAVVEVPLLEVHDRQCRQLSAGSSSARGR